MSDYTLKPRSYKSTAGIVRHTLEVMLRDHPEAFDVLVFPALESDRNEIVAVNRPRATLLDREQRLQEYGPPFRARARIVPEDIMPLEMVDSASFESFHGMQDAVRIVLSQPGVRTFSLIQWLEYPEHESEETATRTVYIAETQPLGRTLDAGVVHVCYPLPAGGEVPELPKQNSDNDDGNTNNQDGGD